MLADSASEAPLRTLSGRWGKEKGPAEASPTGRISEEPDHSAFREMRAGRQRRRPGRTPVLHLVLAWRPGRRCRFRSRLFPNHRNCAGRKNARAGDRTANGVQVHPPSPSNPASPGWNQTCLLRRSLAQSPIHRSGSLRGLSSTRWLFLWREKRFGLDLLAEAVSASLRGKLEVLPL